MNFNAHVLVARQVHSQVLSPDPARGPVGASPDGNFEDLLGLGSALPDLASIARCRLVRDPENPALRLGIALHHATDRAFHDHSWFLDVQARLYDDLTVGGLGRGAARACAHVGVELLIDGYLLRTRSELADDVVASFRTIPIATTSLTGLAADDKQARWRTFLARSAEWPEPSVEQYLPTEVASRLYRILEPRKRLRFEPSQVDVVGSVFGLAVETLETGIDSLVVDVIAEVSASDLPAGQDVNTPGV